MRDHDDEQRAGRGLHRGQRRAQVVADRREEAGALAPDLGDEPGFAHLLLQAEPVDAGREPGDERFQQLAVGRRERLRRAGEQRDARTVDAHVRAVGLVGRPSGGPRRERARLEREQLGERVRRAVQRVVDVGAGRATGS